MTRSTLVLLMLLAVDGIQAGDAKAKPKFTNRLAKEASPYLLMHAHNPTDWYPWGPEAFEKAKKEKKPIFLSIGYSSCFWCHVMERESFNNEEVAKILNEHFVCIKVDREERPEIDQIYMTALNSLGQSGGWPLSMFLLPDGRPIIGGTYFPREDQPVGDKKQPGFKTLLKLVGDTWKDAPDELNGLAEKLAAATIANLNAARLGIALVKLDRKLVQTVVDSLWEEFDKEYGGFGNPVGNFRGPKFPTPPRLDFLLQQSRRSGDEKLRAMATLTLEKMALGGIYDQLGGGFHRYSTERTWTVPHFEKMLYDNAQLAEVYAEAFAQTKNPLFRRILDETLAYVQREMMSPQGVFYSSQDAETEEEEGRSYVWTAAELKEALPDAGQRKRLDHAYGSGGEPNFEKKYYILRWTKPPAEVAGELKLSEAELLAKLEPVKKKLFELRERREKPLLNRIALTAWSGQMIAGFAKAGQLLEENRYIDVASRAADFVLSQQITADGRLLRTYGAAPGQKDRAAVPAYLEDYAFLSHGLLNLYDATNEKKWLDAARRLTDTMIEFHGDKKAGGYYFTAHDHEKLFARAKDQYDGAQPSGNSMAARNLVRLWRATGEDKYRAEAERIFRTFAAAIEMAPSSLATMAYALDEYLVAQTKKGTKE